MKPTTTYRNTDIRKGSVIKTLILLILLAIAAFSFTSCEKAEPIEPILKNEPTTIYYGVSFTKKLPKRVVATLVESTYHGDKLSTVLIDTIVTESCVLSIVKPSGRYAYIELEAFALGHADRIKVGVSYRGDLTWEVSHTNSCDVVYMNIPEMFIELP